MKNTLFKGRAYLVTVIVVILAVSVFFSSLFISSFSGVAEPGLALSLDKVNFSVGDEVRLQVGIAAADYEKYSFEISSSKKKFTYKGEYNPIMLFYPLEEDIYTAALVEKSTGATYAQVSFSVAAANGSSQFISGASKQPTAKPLAPAEPAIEIATELWPQADPTIQKLYEDAFYTEKDNYLPGEVVHFLRNTRIQAPTAGLQLVLIHKGQVIPYAGSLDSVEYLPQESGEYELVLKNGAGDVIRTYGFYVYAPGEDPDIAKENVLLSENNFFSLKNAAGRKTSAKVSVYGRGQKRVREADYGASAFVPSEKYIVDVENPVKGVSRLELRDVQMSAAGLEIPIEELSGKAARLRSGKTTNAFAINPCLLYTSPSPRDRTRSRMPSSA